MYESPPPPGDGGTCGSGTETNCAECVVQHDKSQTTRHTLPHTDGILPSRGTSSKTFAVNNMRCRKYPLRARVTSDCVSILPFMPLPIARKPEGLSFKNFRDIV